MYFDIILRNSKGKRIAQWRSDKKKKQIGWGTSRHPFTDAQTEEICDQFEFNCRIRQRQEEERVVVEEVLMEGGNPFGRTVDADGRTAYINTASMGSWSLTEAVLQTQRRISRS